MSPNQLILQSLKLKSKQCWGQCVHSWEVERKCTLHPVSSPSSLWLPACSKKLVLTTFSVSQWTLGLIVGTSAFVKCSHKAMKKNKITVFQQFLSFIVFLVCLKTIRQGTAYSILCQASNRIEAYVWWGLWGSAPGPSESLTFMGYRGFPGPDWSWAPPSLEINKNLNVNCKFSKRFKETSQFSVWPSWNGF